MQAETIDTTEPRKVGRPVRPPMPTLPGGGPAELLAAWVKATGGSAAAVARALIISRQHLDRILSEDLRLTPEMAMKVAKWTGTSPVDWLARQAYRDVQRLQATPEFMADVDRVQPWSQQQLPTADELRALTEAPPVKRKRARG
jgi:addiction module HigA family antidote